MPPKKRTRPNKRRRSPSPQRYHQPSPGPAFEEVHFLRADNDIPGSSSRSSVPADPRMNDLPPQLFPEGFEAVLIRGEEGRVLGGEVERKEGDRDEKGRLIKWEAGSRRVIDGKSDRKGKAKYDEDDIWVDRYDIRLLLSSPIHSPSSSRSVSPTLAENDDDNEEKGKEEDDLSTTGMSDLPSDSEEMFYFSKDDWEDIMREKKRRKLDEEREKRVREREREEREEMDGMEGVGEQDDEEGSEPPPEIQSLMSRLSQTLKEVSNPSLLEIQILANHGSDPRFSFLRKGGKWRDWWEGRGERERMEKEEKEERDRVEAERVAMEKKEEEKNKMKGGGGEGLGLGLVDYGDEEDDEDAPELGEKEEHNQADKPIEQEDKASDHQIANGMENLPSKDKDGDSSMIPGPNQPSLSQPSSPSSSDPPPPPPSAPSIELVGPIKAIHNSDDDAVADAEVDRFLRLEMNLDPDTKDATDVTAVVPGSVSEKTAIDTGLNLDSNTVDARVDPSIDSTEAAERARRAKRAKEWARKRKEKKEREQQQQKSKPE